MHADPEDPRGDRAHALDETALARASVIRAGLAWAETLAPGSGALSDDPVLVATLARVDGADRTAPSTAAPSVRGQPIGRYLLLSQLGAGAMGIVFAAYDPELDRRVALKLLKHHSGDVAASRKRLQREAQALAKLGHPNVVAVHDVGVHEDRVFVAMEFVEGKTLGAWMGEPRATQAARSGSSGSWVGAKRTLRARPWREVLDVFMQAGRGLAAAHEAGLVHRDFKPKTRSPLGRSPFSPSGRILKNRGVSRPGPWRVVPPHAAVLATGWQSRCRHERTRALPSARNRPDGEKGPCFRLKFMP